MKIVLWGTYDLGKPRVRLLIDGLQKNGIELLECHSNVWNGVRDKSQMKGIGMKVSFCLRWFLQYPKLLYRYCRLPAHDFLLICYPGLVDIFFIKLFAKIRGVPVIWDMFISAYDTVVADRQIVQKNSLIAKSIWSLELFALKIADFVFLDTETHSRRIEKLYGLSINSFGVVWVGVEAESFQVTTSEDLNVANVISENPIKVLFYGQFIPLHGIQFIIEAARLLEDRNIEWTLIGEGQDSKKISEMLSDRPLKKLQWINWVEYDDLKNWIDLADICLGIFGTSGKADSVIPNKVFQIIAAQKPLITRDSSAIRELIKEDTDCIRLVRSGDPKAIAEAVETLALISESNLPTNCHQDLLTKIDCKAIGAQFKTMINQKKKAGLIR